ncbi:hypothetical protein LJ655_13295 [Paraburkholderia sp. MMS20-SJTN17]|uniref:Uncharacterized protein n=1 Tax=Paraburkholderia translucens TaxID=2886945 RepID=A0ABS8KDS3_9BURK|nr:hypothetical protein [Paraburkholderia sp. MMS20-SJTN17]MCC8402850.1 hypothetical protein [Paraburkholderia sp. MMS20-SJTN17]
MKIINNGNFAPWFRILLWAMGIALAAASYFLLSGIEEFVGVVVGMIVLATGTYAERANMLHLKPFDNSYEKARKSYETKVDEEEK